VFGTNRTKGIKAAKGTRKEERCKRDERTQKPRKPRNGQKPRKVQNGTKAAKRTKGTNRTKGINRTKCAVLGRFCAVVILRRMRRTLTRFSEPPDILTCAREHHRRTSKGISDVSHYRQPFATRPAFFRLVGSQVTRYLAFFATVRYRLVVPYRQQHRCHVHSMPYNLASVNPLM
jgi:hypothetical protein